MTLDDEIRRKILQLPDTPEIIDDWDFIVGELSDDFRWIGSKIDWEKTIDHKYSELHGGYSDWLGTIKCFIKDNKINNLISKSNEIFYINDSSLDFSVRLNNDQFYHFLSLAVNDIPQHHYFFERKSKWCLVISSEGYIDFGFSPKIA